MKIKMNKKQAIKQAVADLDALGHPDPGDPWGYVNKLSVHLQAETVIFKYLTETGSQDIIDAYRRLDSRVKGFWSY